METKDKLTAQIVKMLMCYGDERQVNCFIYDKKE